MLFLRKSFSVKLMIQIGKNLITQRSFLVLFLLLFFSESRRRTCVVRTSKTRAEDHDVISSACAAEGKGQTEVKKGNIYYRIWSQLRVDILIST